ncbi:MAG: acetate--CoA ligase family protein [Planctomycetes bacterium]|nr:acetate--CoA ligase family protein [Planctomycetota bacterium]
MKKPRKKATTRPERKTRGSKAAKPVVQGAAGLDALFRPRAVAVIGASRRPGSIGREVLRNLVSGGFEGKVFPVNPKASVLHSFKCHPTVTAIPDPVDLAVICVPKKLVLETVKQCAKKGVGAIVVITAGFRETGPEGAKEEKRILDVTRAHGMRMVGPNCMGIQNAQRGVRLNASFSRNFPDQGPVAFVSQSGAMGEAILAHADRINLGVSMFVSVGNRADVSANDLLDYWARDESIRCVLLYIESFGNPRNFVPIARRITRHKAIVTVKSGRSKAGALAATSHTGALAGADVAADAILKDCGVQRVGTVEEFFDVALALSRLPLPQGPRVAVLTNAGGPAIMATDALVASGLEMAPLQKKTAERLRRILVPEASVQNPIDMVAGATAQNYADCLRLLLDDATVDMVLVIFVPPIILDPVEVAHRVFETVKGAQKPVVGCFMSRDEVMDDIAASAPQDWVPVYLYPESAVRALAALDERRRILERPEGKVHRLRVDIPRLRALLKPGWQGVEVRRQLAQAYRIPAVPGGLAHSPNEAVAIADRVGYPVVMKMSVPGMPHKSDVGGVLLNVNDAPSVWNAFARLMRPDAEGVNVQKMLSGGREVVVGFTAHAHYGPILMFGLGGVFVEVLKDVSFALCPVTDVRAREMIRGIRGYAILEGIRGQASINEDELVAVLQRVSQMAIDLPEIAEMELNPILAFPHGVVGVDMRVRVEERS